MQIPQDWQGMIDENSQTGPQRMNAHAPGKSQLSFL